MTDEARVQAVLARAVDDWEIACIEAGVYVEPPVVRSLLRPAMRLAVEAALRDCECPSS